MGLFSNYDTVQFHSIQNKPRDDENQEKYKNNSYEGIRKVVLGKEDTQPSIKAQPKKQKRSKAGAKPEKPKFQK